MSDLEKVTFSFDIYDIMLDVSHFKKVILDKIRYPGLSWESFHISDNLGFGWRVYTIFCTCFVEDIQKIEDQVKIVVEKHKVKTIIGKHVLTYLDDFVDE